MSKPSGNSWGQVVIATALALVIPTSVVSAANIPVQVIAGGSGLSSSSSYSMLSIVGQATPPGTVTTPVYRFQSAFIPALFGSMPPTEASHTLVLHFSGTGKGIVTSSQSGLTCNTDCQTALPAGQLVSLAATPSPYSIFNGWSGACSGVGDCILFLNQPRTATATFDLDLAHRVQVTGSGYFTSLQGAYDGAPQGGTVLAWAIRYQENLVCSKNKAVILDGGYDQQYRVRNGMTELQGVLTIVRGSLTAGNIVIR